MTTSDSVAAAQSLRPRTIGDILDAAVQLYRHNFGVFLGAIAIAEVPAATLAVGVAVLRGVAPFFAADSGEESPQAGTAELVLFFMAIGATLVTVAVSWVANVLSTGALAWLISQRYLGHSGTIREAYSAVMRQIWPLLATTLLVGLVVGIGAMLCLIPGIIFAVMYVFHVPIVMLEGLSTSRAMSRSQWLVRNDGWRVFGCVVLLWLLAGMLPAAIVTGPVAVLTGVFTSHIPPMLAEGLNQAAAQFGPLVFAPIWMGGIVLLYYDERIRKEGYDLATMASELTSRSQLDSSAHIP